MVESCLPFCGLPAALGKTPSHHHLTVNLLRGIKILGARGELLDEVIKETSVSIKMIINNIIFTPNPIPTLTL